MTENKKMINCSTINFYLLLSFWIKKAARNLVIHVHNIFNLLFVLKGFTHALFLS